MTINQHKQENPNYQAEINERIRQAHATREKENPNYWKEREAKSKKTKVANGHDANWNNRDKFRKTLSEFSDE